MAFQFIASHIQHELQEEAERRRFERLVRRGRRSTRFDRLRVAVGQRLVSVGVAVGGDAATQRRSQRLPARRVAT
jgi:hypothetical protein